MEGAQQILSNAVSSSSSATTAAVASMSKEKEAENASKLSLEERVAKAKRLLAEKQRIKEAENKEVLGFLFHLFGVIFADFFIFFGHFCFSKQLDNYC